MPQSSNRILDEFARFMTDAAGVAKGVRSEVETVVRTQAEKVLRDLDVVQREEFEAVKAMAAKAREENEALKSRIAALETAAGIEPPAAPKKAAARKATTRKPASTRNSSAAKSKE
ncbi:accessory factor UbiK family protein [Microbaculum sp. FT89]|uniref:accessory factor UbiK family protein n=1 Tax=Microbaculum sp. FT89 TaxID=3447298 RepID=UPI003F52CE8C